MPNIALTRLFETASAESDDTLEGATPIAGFPFETSDTVRHFLSDTDPRDWYRIDIPVTGIYVFELTGFEGIPNDNGLVAPFMAMYDDQGQFISSTTHSFSASPQPSDGRVTITTSRPVQAGETYYIQVYPVGTLEPDEDAETPLPYTLRAFAPLDPDGYGKSFSEATPVDVPDQISGTLFLETGTSEWLDYFTFEAPQDGLIEITLSGVIDTIFAAIGDRHQFTVLGGETNPDGSVTLQYPVIAGETYFLRLEHLGAAGTTYQLDFGYADAELSEYLDTDGPTVELASSLGFGQEIDNTVGFDGDAKDYFAFTAPTSGTVSLAFEGYNDSLRVFVFDADGNQVDVERISTGDPDVSWQVESDETFTIAVFSQEMTGTPYQFAAALASDEPPLADNGTEGDDTITGGGGDDDLRGGLGNDTLDGSFGNDTLRGEDGNDTLVGGNGNDVLIGGPGDDRLEGGSGDDAYRIDSEGDQVIESAGQGFDTVFSSFSYTLPIRVERLALTGSDDIDGTGHNGGTFLVGNSGNNTLTGDSWADTLDGGAGKDTLIGGAWHDVYFVDNVNDVVIEKDEIGYDSISSSATYTLPDNVERIILTGSADTDATAGPNADRLIGNTGNNVLLGLAGDDVLEGKAGSDQIDGGVGNDFLYGDEGNDTIIGGLGADLMAGGAGRDVFRYSAAEELNGDLITDFEAGAGGDQLDFSALFDAIGYSGSTPIQDGYIALDQVGADTVARLDLDGGGDSFSVSLTLRAVTASDIIDEQIVS